MTARIVARRARAIRPSSSYGHSSDVHGTFFDRCRDHFDPPHLDVYTYVVEKVSGTTVACRAASAAYVRPEIPATCESCLMSPFHRRRPTRARSRSCARFQSGTARWKRDRPAVVNTTSLAPVLARPAPDPSLLLERLQRAGERRAVENQDLPETALRDFPDADENLKERELGDGQARSAELFVVELADGPCGPPQVRAPARQDAECGLHGCHSNDFVA